MRFCLSAWCQTTACMVLLLMTLAGCGGRTAHAGSGGGDTMRYAYSRLLHTVNNGLYRDVTVRDPWDSTRLLAHYWLVGRRDSARVVESVPQDVDFVVVPVRRAVVSTSSLCSLLLMIRGEQCVSGVLDSHYVMMMPYYAKGIASGGIADCGDGMNPSLERMTEAGADCVFLTPYQGSDYARLSRLGVPLVYCAEYMEPHPLARAEWMKFYGMLTGREHEADSLFEHVRSEYGAVRRRAAKARKRPLVLTERVYGGTWFCPGGRSTVARMIADANARYFFAADSHEGSVPLTVENVIARACGADYWLFTYTGDKPLGREALLAENRAYSQIKAFNTDGVYQCNNMRSRFFEETSFRPDLLLADYVAVFHPELRGGAKLRYYEH